MHQFHKFILAWNSTCFGQFVCPSSEAYSLYTHNWYRSYNFRTGAYAPVRKLSTNLYDIYHCSVYSEQTPDVGQRNCPKHVEFHDKIVKLVHLVGFIAKKVVCSVTAVTFVLRWGEWGCFPGVQRRLQDHVLEDDVSITATVCTLC